MQGSFENFNLIFVYLEILKGSRKLLFIIGVVVNKELLKFF